MAGASDPQPDQSLALIPRAVRDKLDCVGLKMHLKEWQALPLSERQRLCELSCTTAEEAMTFAAEVERQVLRVTGKPAERLPPQRP